MTAPRTGPALVFRPHPGPQTTFLRWAGRDCFFGGAAGPGKSVCLIAAGLRRFAHPNYRGKIFRRTRKMATELIIKANRMVKAAFPGARYNGNENAFLHPSGGRLDIGYLRHDMDLENEEGQEYQFCVARGTPILMADGTYRPVETVRVGDLVMTLQGPAPVTLTPPALVKPCFSITVGDVTVVASIDHQVLTPDGWAALWALTPTPRQSFDTTCEASQTTRPSTGTQPESSASGRSRPNGPAPQVRHQEARRAIAVSTAVQESGSAASDGSRPVMPPPAPWSVQLVLHAPGPRSGAQGSAPESRLRAHGHAQGDPSPLDSPLGCHAERGFGDALAPRDREGAQSGTPSRAGAETRSPSCPRSDGQAKTRERSQSVSGPRPFGYFHPYTRAKMDASEGVRLGQAWLAPAGEAEVYDLRVAGYSQYITSGGIVSQNCGFDELCQFPEHQAKFLHGRLRSDHGLHLEYKGTGNPRGIGLLWVKNHYVDPAPPMTTHWHSFKAPNGTVYKTSTMFVPGRLEDNPSVGQDYEVSLASVGNAKLYDALRHGKWDALLGDALPEWDADVHVLTWAEFAMMHGLILRVRANGEEYCEIPDYWPIYMGYDWGTAAPFSCCWYTCDDHGRMYRIYEWYGAQKTREGATIRNKGIHMSTSDQARGILAREQQWGIAGRVEHRVADPSIKSNGNRHLDIEGPDILEIMADEGVYMSLANNNRKLGKVQIHERLRVAEFRNEDGSIDETPGFMAIKETCPEFLATVPILPSAPNDPEDVDKTAEAHAYDSWRYVCMSRPYKAKLEPVEATWLAKRKQRKKGDAA